MWLSWQNTLININTLTCLGNDVFLSTHTHTHPHQVFIGGGSGSLSGNVNETQIIYWYAKNVSMQTCYVYVDRGWFARPLHVQCKYKAGVLQKLDSMQIINLKKKNKRWQRDPVFCFPKTLLLYPWFFLHQLIKQHCYNGSIVSS